MRVELELLLDCKVGKEGSLKCQKKSSVFGKWIITHVSSGCLSLRQSSDER